jgi:hypothetical protein
MWNDWFNWFSSTAQHIISAYFSLVLTGYPLSAVQIKYMVLTNTIAWIAAGLASIARFSTNARAGHTLIAEFSVDLCAAALAIGLAVFVDVAIWHTSGFLRISAAWAVVLPLMAICGLLLANRSLHEIAVLDSVEHRLTKYILATFSCLCSALILILGSGLSWQKDAILECLQC